MSETGKSTADSGSKSANSGSKAATKREAIRRKVDASKTDLARRASPDKRPPEGIRALAADYPFALLLGGAALGVLAGIWLPRGARLAAGSRFSRKAAAAAGIAAELGLAYGKRALEAAAETAGDAREKVGEIGETVGDSASGYSQRVAGAAREAASTIGRQAIRLRSHLRH